MKPIFNGSLIAPPSFQNDDWMLGTATKSLCALAAGAMAIVGIAGSQPFHMATIAAIVIGASFMFEHGAIATQAARLVKPSGFRGEAEDGQPLRDRMELVVTFSAGILGVITGMMTLLGYFDVGAVDIATIVFGLALTFGLRSVKDTNGPSSARSNQGIIPHLVEAATAFRSLGGLAIVVLGVLAFVGVNRLDLTLIAILIAAVSQLLGSATRISMLASASGSSMNDQRN